MTTKKCVNAFVKTCIAAVFLIAGLAVYQRAYAQVKCESDGRGGTCCWDTRQFGPFRPITCG